MAEHPIQGLMGVTIEKIRDMVNAETIIGDPGHVDFQYEVSRSLAACEGAVLVVDASQGVEAQTLANCYLALDHNLEVVPILNKIDLPSADPDAVAKEVEDVIGLPCMEAPRVSAKLGIGVKEVLESVARDIPAPTVCRKGFDRELLHFARGIAIIYSVNLYATEGFSHELDR